MRLVLAVVAGYAVWTMLWLGGNAALSAMLPGPAAALARGEAQSGSGYLAGALALSLLCSFVAGFVTAAVAPARARVAVLSMATLLVITGIGVQAGLWSVMPLWYHASFLALLVPMSIVGGRARA